MRTFDDVKYGAGLLLDVGFKLGGAIRQAGGGDPYPGIQLLTQPRGKELLANLGAMIVDYLRGSSIKKIMVERQISLEKAIEACNFDEVEDGFERLSLPPSPNVVREIVPISILCEGHDFKRCGGLDEMLDQLKEMSCRPANLGELLALIATVDYNYGATLVLERVEIDGKQFVCFVDDCADDWNPIPECRHQRKILRMVDEDNLVGAIRDIMRRNPEKGANQWWVLAVRET